MKVNQIFEIVNTATSQVLGKEALVEEDLSNIVDVGKAIVGADAVDSYVKSLVNHIGKVIFDNRVYTGSIPSVLMDGWEFGSILEKVSSDIPDAQENKSWELKDGTAYSQDIFYQPKVDAKFFNDRITFEVPVSFTELQVKQSFSNAEQLNGFLSMLYNGVEKSLTIKTDALVMKAVNNMTAETLEADTGDGTGVLDKTKQGSKAINLLALYNAKTKGELEAEASISNPEFIQFASYIINLQKDRMTKISTLFNVGGKAKFTPESELTIVLLSDFARASDIFLQSETFHKELVELPNYETVPYWQGSGVGYDFKDVSRINVKSSQGNTVDASGILGVMFDRQAVGVANLDKRVTSNYNARAEFFTNYYKLDAGYFNDLNENFLVFYVA